MTGNLVKIISPVPYRRRKAKLKPGMVARNIRTGNMGELRADPDRPKKLYTCSDYFVAVRRRLTRGKHPGQWIYTFWNLDHVKFK